MCWVRVTVQPLPGGAILLLAAVSLPLYSTVPLLVPVSPYQADVVARRLFLPSLLGISIQQIIGSSSDIERIGLPLSFSGCSVEHASVYSKFWGLDITQLPGPRGKHGDVPSLSGHLNDPISLFVYNKGHTRNK